MVELYLIWTFVHNFKIQAKSSATDNYNRNMDSIVTSDLVDGVEHCDNEYILGVMTDLDITKRRFADEQQRVSELEEQLSALSKEPIRAMSLCIRVSLLTFIINNFSSRKSIATKLYCKDCHRRWRDALNAWRTVNIRRGRVSAFRPFPLFYKKEPLSAILESPYSFIHSPIPLHAVKDGCADDVCEVWTKIHLLCQIMHHQLHAPKTVTTVA